MKKTGIAGVILAACLSLLGAVSVYGEAEGGQERAMEGVYIENINVSGMAEEEITNAIQGKIEELSQSHIEFYVGGSGVAVTAGDLGLNYTNDTIVRQALEVGQKGNVLQRFETTRTMEEKGPLVLELQYAVDGDKVRTVVEEQCVALNHSAVNMSLKRESNGSFTTVAGQDGASLKVEESIQTIQNFFSREW
ncbi:MAG TPA: peptidoglycan binding domain-containing protein, partial [Candidatus Pelethocola excrementipullorum]|nr:peptidoglycan binding domain-containing protein [Candidatus Pelethocola excrementipullorum]